jgi:outer membrane receptor protein involved in Fe transport
MEVGLYDSFHVVDDADFSGNDNGTLWKVNAAYDLSDTVMTYGTFSQGYRRGGANAVPLSGIFAEDPVWQTYDSDSVNNYELGVKGTTGRNSFFTIAYFYVDWSEIQLNTATDNGAFFAVQNGGEAHTTGFEFEYDWYFAEDWHQNAGYAYTVGELDDNLYAPTDPDELFPIAPEGTPLPGLSRNTVNLTVDNTYQLSGDWDWINRVSGYYQSSMENSILQSPSFDYTLDGFSIWDFNSTLASDNWAISLFVKNLFNEEGVVGLFSEQYMGTDPAQNYYGNGSKEYIARPRTVGLNVRYNF